MENEAIDWIEEEDRRIAEFRLQRAARELSRSMQRLGSSMQLSAKRLDAFNKATEASDGNTGVDLPVD